jgi:hypothetical protein
MNERLKIKAFRFGEAVPESACHLGKTSDQSE